MLDLGRFAGALSTSHTGPTGPWGETLLSYGKTPSLSRSQFRVAIITSASNGRLLHESCLLYTIVTIDRRSAAGREGPLAGKSPSRGDPSRKEPLAGPPAPARGSFLDGSASRWSQQWIIWTRIEPQSALLLSSGARRTPGSINGDNHLHSQSTGIGGDDPVNQPSLPIARNR